jgi:hypothetical protein
MENGGDQAKEWRFEQSTGSLGRVLVALPAGKLLYVRRWTDARQDVWGE